MELQFTKETAGKDAGDLQSLVDSLLSRANLLKDAGENPVYAAPDSFVALPNDESHSKNASVVAREFSGVRYVFVVGIGGSNLGAKAVYDALRGTLSVFEKSSPHIIFLDVVHP